MLTREVLRAIRQIVGAVELAGMDIVEVSPPYDHAETTAMVANRAALEAISALRRRSRQAGAARPLRADGPDGHGTPPDRADRPMLDRPEPRPPRRSPGCTTSTWSRTRATSTCTSRWPTGPTARSSSSPSGRPPGRPARRGRPPRDRRRPRPGDARPGPAHAAAAGAAGADRLDARRGGPASASGCPTPARTAWRSSPSTRCSLLADPRRPAAALRTLADHLAPGRPGRRRRLAARRRRPRPLRRPDHPRVAATDPETGRDRDQGRRRALHDAATAIVTLTTIFEEGGQGGPPRRWIRRDRLRLVVGRRAARVRRGGRARGRAHGRRLRPRAARPGQRAGDPRRAQALTSRRLDGTGPGGSPAARTSGRDAGP